MPTEEEIAKAAADRAKEAEESDDAKPVTMADIKALFSKDLPTMVNSAVATHTKRLKSDFDKQLAALKQPKDAEADENAEDQASSVQAKAKPAVVTEQQRRVETPAAAPPDPQIAKLQRQLELMQAKQRESDQKATLAERRRIESEGYQSLKTILTGKVAAGSEDVVIAALKGRNAVVFGDDGTVRLKLGAKDEPEEGFELADGVSTYMKFQEAKFFLPVPNAGPAVRKTQATTPTQRPAGPPAPDAGEAFQQKFGKSISDVL